MGGGGGVHLGHAHHHGHAQHEEREEGQQRAVAPRHQVLEGGAPLGQLQQLLEPATSGDLELETQVPQLNFLVKIFETLGSLKLLVESLYLCSRPVISSMTNHRPSAC